MKILSFNVRVWTRDTAPEDGGRYWKNRMKKMKDMIIDLDPDIICFQELMFPATLYVPKGYKRVNVSIQHPIYIKKGMTASNHIFKIHMDAATINGSYRVISVHSHWNQNILKRNEEQIRELSKGYDKVIACGDFNNDEQQIGLYPHLERVPMIEEKDTFVNFNRPTESHGIIDHFYVRGLENPSACVLYEYGKVSDHYPILLEFDY